MKKVIKIGSVMIGENYPIAIQSMTNTKTRDINATIEQIQKLEKAGCLIVRVAIENLEDALAIAEIKKRITIPIVADIHFDYQLAIASIDNGADKIRINPGNIHNDEHLHAIVNCAKAKGIPIRIGINSGSLEKDLYEKYGGVTADALLESITRMINKFENWHFDNLVLSIKATDMETTIHANQLLDQKFPYPIHIGLTEAGTFTSGIIRSSYVLGKLLENNIGNTIRISLNGDPINEIAPAKEILAMFNKFDKPTLICCPTCGRTNYDMTSIVDVIEPWLNTINKKIKVAIMGCVVNGPGEASDADIGIAGGNKQAILFKKGQIIKKLNEEEIIAVLKEEIEKMLEI